MKGFKLINEIFKRVKTSLIRIMSNDIYVSSEVGSANCRVDTDGNIYVGGNANNAYMKVVFIQDSGKIEKAIIAEVI